MLEVCGYRDQGTGRDDESKKRETEYGYGRESMCAGRDGSPSRPLGGESPREPLTNLCSV